MEKFKQNKIEHKMPHTLPQADFFETFPKELFAKIEAEQISPIPAHLHDIGTKPPRRLKRFVQISTVGGIAAALAIAFIIGSKGKPSEDGFEVKETIVNNIDSYLSSLSDEEFNNLHVTTMKQSDFYLNLPNY